jgi:ABC-type polysaccharide/polyol phosphate export permease
MVKRKEWHEGKEITQMCKMIAAVGLIVGVSLFLLSFIANAYNKGFFLTIISLGVTGASIFMFGFGTFLGILTERYRNTKESM